uniref:Uncharacterized protein n=1 Tax=Meloidogyne incognita TaxID=6306 RepID=A0A914L0X3_MELIC
MNIVARTSSFITIQDASIIEPNQHTCGISKQIASHCDLSGKLFKFPRQEP